MEQQALSPTLCAELRRLWSRWCDLAPAEVDRLLAPAASLAEALGGSPPDPAPKRRAA